MKTSASFVLIKKWCILSCLFLSCFSFKLSAQVAVSGIVKDKETGRPLSYAFVINHRTQNGIFCDQQGRFSMTTLATDSLLFSLTGYQFTKVILADSIPRPAYKLHVFLTVKSVQLRTFTVKAPKTFEQILVELEKAERMKVKPTSVANALESPITYLYMQFSKEGRATRKIAELRSENAKQELIRELFTRYMVAHIIDLNENDMDDYIRFSGLSYSLKTFDTEYDLVVFVKQQFVQYKKYRGIED